MAMIHGREFSEDDDKFYTDDMRDKIKYWTSLMELELIKSKLDNISLLDILVNKTLDEEIK